jgi:hypothetical protein
MLKEPPMKEFVDCMQNNGCLEADFQSSTSSESDFGELSTGKNHLKDKFLYHLSINNFEASRSLAKSLNYSLDAPLS